jgi:hypothetical protein
MPSRPASLTTLLSELAASGVKFVLVGGLAAVAQGAPLTTHDVDIVPLRTTENIERLVALLREHDTHYRGRPDRLELFASKRQEHTCHLGGCSRRPRRGRLIVSL